MTKYSTENGFTREQLELLAEKNVCSICGARLEVFRKSFAENIYFLACHDWIRTHHDGEIEQPASRYQKEGVESFNIEKRRKILTEEHGNTKTKALAKYLGGGVISREGYEEIVNTLWGEAPPAEKTKAILLCQAYKLNPLMKHLYLIPFNKKDRSGNIIGKDWAVVMGIGATRLLAQRKHNFSYLDMTPRAASPEEVRKITGKPVDPNLIYGFAWIKDVNTGAEAFGLRWIKKSERVHGLDKGNSHLNLACIRAERQAIDRQYPGEMPEGVDVVDERYMEEPLVRAVDKDTGEIIEGHVTEVLDTGGSEESTAIEPTAIEPTHWCDEHKCPFEMKTGRFGEFYAHKKTAGGWCNEGKKKDKDKDVKDVKDAQSAPVDEPQAVPESEEAGEMWSGMDSAGSPESALAEKEVVEAKQTEAKQTASQEPATTEMIGYIEADWLRESLKKLKGKKLKAWTDANLLSYFKVTYKVADKTLMGAIAKLDKNQAAHFVKNIQETLAML